MDSFLLKGALIGFSIAAPVGPIGLLCIRRSVTSGRMAGLITGFGAASADAVYGFIAAFGLTAITSMLIAHERWFGLFGGAFLCYLAFQTFRSQPGAATAANERFGSAYFSTFVLTLTNPLTILSFLAVFAGLGIGSEKGDYSSAAALVFGVFAGSPTPTTPTAPFSKRRMKRELPPTRTKTTSS